MLVNVRYKNQKGRILTGIPVQQWVMPTEEGDKIRFYLLIPGIKDGDAFSHVGCIVEEAQEWQIVDNDDAYNNHPLDTSQLFEVDEATQSDLYYVWDDGAEKHMDRAKRLNEAFKNEIVKYWKD